MDDIHDPAPDGLEFDEVGDLVDDDVLGTPRPCQIETLRGSWLLEFEPPATTLPLTETRGPMRIEVGLSSLRVSGDLYTRRLPEPEIVLTATRRPEPWYPQFPQNQYSWYFRSTGATYSAGVLQVSIERHIWDRTTEEFTRSDTGTLQLRCRRPLIVLPGSLRTMNGTLRIGLQSIPVTATRTSSRAYRGCRIEVDVMSGRSFVGSARLCTGTEITFREVYAVAGWDMRVRVDELTVPEDTVLTVPELHQLLSTHREPAGDPDEWRQWLLVGSADDSGLYGLMFDQNGVPREGAVGFADATLSDDPGIEPDARGKALSDVPLAFFRTLLHEVGHGLNLLHPKSDVHDPPVSRTLMNQTGDIVDLASATDRFPCNATFGFNTHNRISLIHSPDPQVKPGWKAFRWGHGSDSAGLPEPTDLRGRDIRDVETDLRLDLALPAVVHPGEFVVATFALTNIGDRARRLRTQLDLAGDELRLLRRRPSGAMDRLRDVVLGCGLRPSVDVAPGESITGWAQLLYTNHGFTFDEPGPHELVAELDVGHAKARSASVRVLSRQPHDEAGVAASDLALDERVGLAFAFGDFGADTDVETWLGEHARSHPHTTTGAAAALVLANAYGRAHTDYTTRTIRRADPQRASEYFELAAGRHDADRLAELAVAVVSPVEPNAPVVGMALLAAGEEGTPRPDRDRAAAIIAMFRR